MTARPQVLRVRMSPIEFHNIIHLASKRGVSPSEAVRQLVAEEVTRTAVKV